jgi:hypothetical protein
MEKNVRQTNGLKMFRAKKNIDDKALSWKSVDLILSVILILIVFLVLFYFG